MDADKQLVPVSDATSSRNPFDVPGDDSVVTLLPQQQAQPTGHAVVAAVANAATQLASTQVAQKFGNAALFLGEMYLENQMYKMREQLSKHVSLDEFRRNKEAIASAKTTEELSAVLLLAHRNTLYAIETVAQVADDEEVFAGTLATYQKHLSPTLVELLNKLHKTPKSNSVNNGNNDMPSLESDI